VIHRSRVESFRGKKQNLRIIFYYFLPSSKSTPVALPQRVSCDYDFPHQSCRDAIRVIGKRDKKTTSLAISCKDSNAQSGARARMHVAAAGRYYSGSCYYNIEHFHRFSSSAVPPLDLRARSISIPENPLALVREQGYSGRSTSKSTLPRKHRYLYNYR